MSDIVREAAQRYRNWGKWGPDDELGTLNYITPEVIRKSAQMVKRGVTFSLAIPFDSTGPQINQPRRFNPIHRMILTGPDFTTGAFKRPGGVGFADDMVIMALQCATQWDALSQGFARTSCYTEIMGLRNVTITLDEDVVRWARIRAAERETSVSRLVGELLREKMLEDQSYEAAMREYLTRPARRLKKTGTKYPRRADLYGR